MPKQGNFSLELANGLWRWRRSSIGRPWVAPCAPLLVQVARGRMPAKPPRAADVAGLVLVERDGRTAWAFTERIEGAPPLAKMCDGLESMEAVGRLAGADPESYWWWITDEALDAIAAELNSANYCVLDRFLGSKGAKALRKEVRRVRTTGHLKLSRLAGGRSGANVTYSHTAVRGDHVGWFDGEEADMWPRGTLTKYLTKVDTLVAQLGPRVSQLRDIAHRSKAMVACYPGGGARYVRHCDNSCESGHGERCNGRRLTAIIYLNEGWTLLHGGELRLFAPFAPKGVPPLCDVAPLADRLVLFYADYRVPHEVLPAHDERLAITAWYFDGAEHKQARLRGAAAEQVDSRESDSIEKEIRRFEERFGSDALTIHESKETGPTALSAG